MRNSVELPIEVLWHYIKPNQEIQGSVQIENGILRTIFYSRHRYPVTKCFQKDIYIIETKFIRGLSISGLHLKVVAKEGRGIVQIYIEQKINAVDVGWKLIWDIERVPEIISPIKWKERRSKKLEES